MVWFERLGIAVMIALASVASAAAGSVSGLAVDENGSPLAGVHVEVVYQTYRTDQIMGYGASVKAKAVTGEDGRYTIQTGHLPPGEYSAHAYRVAVNGGRQTNIDLTVDDGATFAGNATVVRNFTAGIIESSEKLPYGNAGVFVVNNDIGDYTDLSAAEVTLVNVETGKTYVKMVRSSGDGLVVTGIPFGAYRASVSLNGRPMQIALWGPEESGVFSSSVVHDFTMGYTENQIQVVVKP